MIDFGNACPKVIDGYCHKSCLTIFIRHSTVPVWGLLNPRPPPLQHGASSPKGAVTTFRKWGPCGEVMVGW